MPSIKIRKYGFWGRNVVALMLVVTVYGGTAHSAPDVLDYVSQAIEIQNNTRTVTVPAGYVLEVLATDLDAPRMLTFAANGDLFAGSRRGRVYRIPPPYTNAKVWSRPVAIHIAWISIAAIYLSPRPMACTVRRIDGGKRKSIAIPCSYGRRCPRVGVITVALCGSAQMGRST